MSREQVLLARTRKGAQCVCPESRFCARGHVKGRKLYVQGTGFARVDIRGEELRQLRAEIAAKSA